MSFSKNHIDASTRIKIGLSAYSHKGIYGHVTKLADYYDVSRWFIYFCLQYVMIMVTDLEGSPSSLLDPPAISQVVSVKDAVLALYLDCESSISGIQRAI